MPIPAGISTALVHLDAPVSFIGDEGRIHATITPSTSLVWEATGTPIGNFIDNVSLDPGKELELDLPHVDQPGFLDGAGNTITGWAYRIEITYEKDGQNIPLPAKDFQILVGQDEVDLALIPSGTAYVPVVAPILPVTSVAGYTGEVTDAELDAAIGALSSVTGKVSKGELVYNVKDYGALGDGVANDTAAIQAAIDAAGATNGLGIVFVPRGNYLVSTLTVKPFVTIRGAGRYRTTITARPGADAAMIQFPSGNVQNVYIEDLQLAPGAVPNAGQHGVYAHARAAAGQSGGWWYGGMRRVRIAKFDGHGLWLRGGGMDYLKPHQFLTFEGVESFAGPNATSRSVLITGQVGQALFSACELDGNGQGVAGAGTSVEIKREVDDAGANLSDMAGYTIDFLNCTIQANALGARVERANTVKFDNCWFEDLSSGVVFDTSVEMGIVTSCSFGDAGANGSGTGYLIQAGPTSTVVADANRFAGAYDRDLVANASNGVIISKGQRTSKTNLLTAGMTKQYATATIGIDNNTTALISSGPAIATINSKHAPGDIIHLRAWTADFSLVSGGNINLSGHTSPLVVQNGQIATLVRMDLGVTGWGLVSISGNKPNLVNAKDYGAKGDGVADDTAALQSFITHLVTNGVKGFIPKGTYKISAALNFPLRAGWEIQGAGKLSTIIKQDTDNVPIFNIGSDTASTMHNWGIDGLGFDYTNTQPVTNTLANCIQFAQEVNNGYLTNLLFLKGRYAFAVSAGKGCPWGCTWDNLNFGSGLTGGAIDMSAGVNGVPNNSYRRMFVTATNMVGPVFHIRGYNTTVDNVEIIHAQLGPVLWRHNSGGELTMGALKLENGVYAASQTLLDFQGSSKVKLGQFSLGGSTMTISGAATKVTALASGGGLAGGALAVDNITLDPDLSGGAQLFAVQASNSAHVTVGTYSFLAGAKLVDQGSTTAGETTTVTSQVTGRLSGNLGDANYTAVLGGPNKLQFATPFTAQRFIDLPTDNNNLFNGLYYEVIFDGAINGPNTGVIRCNGTWLRVQTADKAIVGFTYRRNPANPQGGWVLTRHEPLPGSNQLTLNVKDNGVRGDAIRNSSGGSITSGSAVFTGAGFTALDVGKFFSVAGAGTAGAALITTILSYQSATQVTLAASAVTTVANAAYLYGSDDTAAIQALLDGVTNLGYNSLFFPRGSYLTGKLNIKSNTQLVGQSRGGWAYEFYDRCTRLIAKPGITAGGFLQDYNGVVGGNVRITDMMLDGAKAFHTNAITGIHLADSAVSADSLWSIERVYAGFFTGDGIYLGEYRRANRVNDCHFWQNTGNGMTITGTDNGIFQTVMGQNGGHGINLAQAAIGAGGANHFINCDSFGNGGHGAKMVPMARMNLFTSCMFDVNLKSGIYTEAKNTSLSQCRFTNNSQETDGVYPDVDVVGGPAGVVLTNPMFYAVVPTPAKLPHSGIRAAGNTSANPVLINGFSYDPSVTTWRSGAYVEGPVRTADTAPPYIKSANGTLWKVTVGDDGTLTTTAQ